MAFSLFSHKKVSDQGKSETETRTLAVVRTMRDDIESMKRGGNTPAFPQEKQLATLSNSPFRPSSKQPVNPFSEEGEKLFQKEASSTEEMTDNPFGVISTSKKNMPGKFPSQPITKKGLAPTILGGELLISQSQRRKNVFSIGIFVVAIILMISGGAYYYFFMRGEKGGETAPLEEMVPVVPEAVVIPQKELPYALDKPNYLSMSVETVSPLDIKNVLSSASSRIKDASISQPIEFLVTDQNNNPLAFSRFAFLLKLDINPDLLALVDETFSLYAYNDAGNMRLGLDLTLKDASAVISVLSKIEGTLPYAFQALLLEPGITVPKSVVFKSNVYNPSGLPGKDFAVRYANIDTVQNISLDYVVAGNHWYLGLSKNTLRAILDATAK